MLRVAPQVVCPGYRPVILGQRKGANVAQERVGRCPGPVRLMPGLLCAPQIRQRVGHGIRDLELRLIGGNLVDDVPVGGSQGGQCAVPALIDVRRVALVHEALPRELIRQHKVLLGRPDLGAERGDEPVAQIGAFQDQRQLLIDRTVERLNRVDPEKGNAEDQHEEQGHAAKDPAPQTSHDLHCPPARRTSPS